MWQYIIAITGNVICYNWECNSDNNCNGINTSIGIVMPRRSLVIEENQPSIKTLLSNCPSCTKSKCTKHDSLVLDTTCDSDIEVTSNKNISTTKKRKRKHRSSGSPKDNPNKKPLKKTPEKMAKPDDTTPPLNENNPSTLNPSPTSQEAKPMQLSPELEELE